MGAGLTLLNIWASAGNRINPGAGKIALGWLPGEQPACEYENERQYTRDTLLNAIATYLNTGVPVSDLTAGDVSLTGSSMTFIGGSSAEAFIDDGRVYVEDSTDRSEIRANGLKFLPEISCVTRNLKLISVDLTGATWSTSGYHDDSYYLDQDIDIPDLDFLQSSGIYMGLTVSGYNGASLINYIPQQYVFVTLSGGSTLSSVTLQCPLDPNDLTDPRLSMWVGIADSSVPSGI